MNHLAIAVAKDILERIENINACPGTYMSGYVSRREQNEDLRARVDDVQANCYVCALGACLLSYVRVGQKTVPISDVARRGANMWMMTPGGRENICQQLSDVFCPHQLLMIESAFERRIVAPGDRTDKNLIGAVCFGLAHYYDPTIPHEASRETRSRHLLGVIMKNIVEHDGVFDVPPADRMPG